MDKPNLDIGIPKQSLIYIGFCLAGVLIYLFGGIVPAAKSLVELNEQTATAQYRLEEQKILTPFAQTLMEDEGKKDSEILPMPPREKLPQARINTIPLNLGSAAKTSGMELLSAIPNVKALNVDASLLPVNIVLRGNFVSFRKFLIDLGEIPYIEHIEEIVIQGRPDAKEYRLTLWVAVG